MFEIKKRCQAITQHGQLTALTGLCQSISISMETYYNKYESESSRDVCTQVTYCFSKKIKTMMDFLQKANITNEQAAIFLISNSLSRMMSFVNYYSVYCISPRTDAATLPESLSDFRDLLEAHLRSSMNLNFLKNKYCDFSITALTREDLTRALWYRLNNNKTYFLNVPDASQFNTLSKESFQHWKTILSSIPIIFQRALSNITFDTPLNDILQALHFMNTIPLVKLHKMQLWENWYMHLYREALNLFLLEVIELTTSELPANYTHCSNLFVMTEEIKLIQKFRYGKVPENNVSNKEDTWLPIRLPTHHPECPTIEIQVKSSHLIYFLPFISNQLSSTPVSPPSVSPQHPQKIESTAETPVSQNISLYPTLELNNVTPILATTSVVDQQVSQESQFILKNTDNPFAVPYTENPTVNGAETELISFDDHQTIAPNLTEEINNVTQIGLMPKPSTKIYFPPVPTHHPELPPTTSAPTKTHRLPA